MKKILSHVSIFVCFNNKTNVFSKLKHKNFSFKFLTLAVISLFWSLHSVATTYYTKTTRGYWNSSSTWSTVGYGNPTNAGTYPIAGDIVNIANGDTVQLNASASCATLNIGQGASGMLQYMSTGIYSLTVSGNVTVNAGARLWYNTAYPRNHNCYVGGNFTNSGTVDFWVNSTSVVNLTFNGVGNSNVTGAGSWDMNIVTLGKTLSTTTVDVISTTFESGIRYFSASYGTYIHDNAGTYSVNPTATSFTIGPRVTIRVPMGTMNIAKSVLILQGRLYVSGGTVNAGSNTGNQGIQSDQNGSGVPYLDVSSGTLNVYGGITYGSVSVSEPFSFRMTGGTVNLNIGNASTYRQLFCMTDVANSIFYMSGGTMVFQKPNATGSSVIDASINGTNGTVTTLGGTFQFGNSSTLSGKTFSFKPFANGTYPHFNIAGSTDSVVTLRPALNSTASFKMLSMTINANKVFDMRSNGNTTASTDTKTMTLTSTANGSDALIDNGTFIARKSTVTLNSTGPQAIAASDTISFYNLTINNSNGVVLSVPAYVSNFLSMVDGILYTDNSNILICMADADADLGTTTSYVYGPMIHTVADTVATSKTFPLGSGSSWQPVVLTVTHSDTLAATYSSEMFNSPATGLPLANPSGVTNVSSVRFTYFDRQGASNFVNGIIQVYYHTDDMVWDFNALTLVHDDGSGNWMNIGGTATSNDAGDVVSDTFTVFNNFFALANLNGGNNPLRMAQTSFDAMLSNKNVYLKWTTLSEINTDYFIVERSADNTDFTQISTVKASGNSSSVKGYSLVDAEPLSGTSYYRLTLVHTDGTQERLAPVSINYTEKGNFTVYPTVSDGSNIHLRYAGNDLQQYRIIVLDAQGRQIQATFSPAQNGLDLHLDKSSVSNGGIYFIYATYGSEVMSSKILIAR